MPSGLRAKLQAIAPGNAAKAAMPERGGLVVRTSRREAPEGLLSLPARGLERLGAGEGFSVEKSLFLDTETTGLSGGAGTLAFLVGAAWVEGEELVTEQYILGDHSDEPEMLLRLGELLKRFDTAVTFNGKTFDMPLLESRYTICRLRDHWRALDQLDLLPPARRVWKLRLQSCRLSNLEARVLGVRRENDLPGSEAPERFFRYLQTGDFSLLEEVIDHNLQDVVTLAVLLIKLARLFDAPLSAQDSRDRYSLGRALEKRGDAQAAEVYALSRDVPEGSYRLYILYRRAGEWERARAVLEAMVRKNQMGYIPHIELAKLYEHHDKNCRRALFYTKIALAMCEGPERAAILHRLGRLERKLSEGGNKP